VLTQLRQAWRAWRSLDPAERREVWREMKRKVAKELHQEARDEIEERLLQMADELALEGVDEDEFYRIVRDVCRSHKLRGGCDGTDSCQEQLG